MQGWHSRRILSDGEVGDPIIMVCRQLLISIHATCICFFYIPGMFFLTLNFFVLLSCIIVYVLAQDKSLNSMVKSDHKHHKSSGGILHQSSEDSVAVNVYISHSYLLI